MLVIVFSRKEAIPSEDLGLFQCKCLLQGVGINVDKKVHYVKLKTNTVFLFS